MEIVVKSETMDSSTVCSLCLASEESQILGLLSVNVDIIKALHDIFSVQILYEWKICIPCAATVEKSVKFKENYKSRHIEEIESFSSSDIALKENTFEDILSTENYNLQEFQPRIKLSKINVNKEIEENRKFECDICQKSFIQKKVLKLHLEKQHFPKVNMQRELLVESGPLDIHRGFIEKVLGKKLEFKPKFMKDGSWLCCKTVYSDEKNFVYHRRHVHGNTKKNFQTCSVCAKTFDHRSMFMQHYSAEHKNFNLNEVREYAPIKQADGSWLCCGNKYTNISQHKRRLHHGQFRINLLEDKKKFECYICQAKFYLKLNLKQHLGEKHFPQMKTNSQFQCDICGKYFNRRPYLKKHLLNIHFKKATASYKENLVYSQTFECSVCTQKFKNKNSVKRHLEREHFPRIKLPFVCQICSKSFSQKCYLKTHIKFTHIKKSKANESYKPKFINGSWHCCGKTFNNKQFSNHKTCYHEMHSKFNAFCRVCGKKFESLSLLRVHRKVGHSAKDIRNLQKKYNPVFKEKNNTWTCCGKIFEPRLFYYHKKVLHPEAIKDRVVVCNFCNKKISQRQLKTHQMKEHPGQKSSTNCNVCEERFDFSAQLLKHKKKFHPEIYEN